MKTTGSMRTLNATQGAVRVEELYDTDIDDLWQACTRPDRLSRWIARVSGDLQLGGTVQAVFTSTWSGELRIDVCDAPHHLLLTAVPGSDEETEMEAWLSTEGSQTRLVVEERGLPTRQLHFYGAGWQVHLEDLARTLASGDPAHPDGWSEEAASPAWQERWTALTPAYEEAAAH